MNVWHDVSPGKIPDEVNVIVEIPKGSNNKYEIDKETGLLKLDRVLYSAVYYPQDYGLIPRTLADDGDPLDAFIIVTNTTYPGTLVACRPIGIITMIDQGEGDDKIVCVPVKDPRFAQVKDIKDVPEHLIKEIVNFLETYKLLENKKVEIKGWKDAKAARDMIMKTSEMYKKKFKKK